MRWRTHKAIAKAIAWEAGLRGEILRCLLNGIVDPDKYPEKTVKVKVGRKGRIYTRTVPMSHHNPSIDAVMKHVWRARISFLAGDFLNAAYWIGWALHYIQDRCVGKGIFGLKHESVENGAANVQVEREDVLHGFSEAESSPRFVKAVLYGLRATTNPVDAVREATLASSAVFAAVFSSRTPPKELMRKYGEEKKKHAKIIAGEILSILCMLPLLALGHLPLLLVPAVACMILYLMDGEYRTLRDEARWFGAD